MWATNEFEVIHEIKLVSNIVSISIFIHYAIYRVEIRDVCVINTNEKKNVFADVLEF